MTDSLLTRLTGEPLNSAALSGMLRDLGAIDWFTLFDLPRAYRIDPADLRRRFIGVTRAIHPDLCGHLDADGQAAIQRLSAIVNDAYETLRDPIRRAEFILSLADGRTAAQDKRVPPDILTQSLMLREEIEEARESGDADALAAIATAVGAQKAACEASIENHAESVAAGDESARDALRLALNAWKYLANLAASAAPA